MIRDGDTRRSRIPTSEPRPTYTPEASAEIHSPVGMTLNSTKNATTIRTAGTSSASMIPPRGLASLRAADRPHDDAAALHAHDLEGRAALDEFTFGDDVHPV